MPDDAQDIVQKQVTLIPTDRIRILNPRVRNRRNFEEMVENIAKIGLKRPITVAQRAGTDTATDWAVKAVAAGSTSQVVMPLPAA
jgi:ParB family chromosome partitioning protein